MPRESALETVAGRAKLYAGTIVVVSAAITIIGGAAIRYATSDVSAEIRDNHAELTKVHQELVAFSSQVTTKAVVDSVRFERVMDIVELAVIALVEPTGSRTQRAAVEALRTRRHVTPREEH